MQLNELKQIRFRVACAAFLFLIFCCAFNAAAQEPDTWQFELTVYGWYAGIDGGLKYPVPPGAGSSISIDASDILDNLNMIFMGGIQVQHNRWSILTDLIYMDIGKDVNRYIIAGPAPGVPVNASAGLDISSWILSGGIGYDVARTDRGVFAVLGGVRYLGVDVDARIGLNGPLSFPRPSTERSQSVDQLDGIIGVKGFITLNEKWYLPYYADIGTGDSDLTWQLFAGIGYRFSWGDIKLGYRYLKYELDENKLLEDLELNGPLLGIGFRF